VIQRRLQLGVSLIEALVALAIMAFGMLGVVGMQASLRFNADVSRQRSEAVRLAQEEVERLRNFSALSPTAGTFAFDDIISSTPASVSLPGASNTTYTRTTTVVSSGLADPLMKRVTVSVVWLDRRAASSSDLQTVTLNTIIAGVAPELAGSLSVPGDQAATQRPLERHPAIPPGAVNRGDGTSTFTPGSSTAVWVFNNATGLITEICTPICVPVTAWLLSGFIQFAVTGPPTPEVAESPSDAAITTVGVSVNATAPSAVTVICPVAVSSTFLTYYCAVPASAGTRRWSGRSVLTGIPLATSLADASMGRFKVCRYTSDATTDTPPGGNAAHPLDYVIVTTSLSNQNFLVIKAGDGTTAYGCPGDGPEPLVNSSTRAHQPNS
jgi:Prokaryotic N-terminal methylation motif